jgi:murein peptide amidase A
VTTRRPARIIAAAAAAALLLTALVPAAAKAGGTAVVAPEQLGVTECRQGTEAPTQGFRPRPLAPTVIGCLEIEQGKRALAAVYRFDPPNPGGVPRVCFFLAPRGEVEVDGPCTSIRGREGAPSNVLTGADGFSAVSVRRVGGPTASSPTTAVVGGLARGPRRIVFWQPERSGKDGGFRWARTLRVGPRLASRLGATGPFTFFAVALPRRTDPCGPIKVSGSGLGAARWGLAVAARHRYPSLRSPYCRRAAKWDRALATLRALIDPLRGLLDDTAGSARVPAGARDADGEPFLGFSRTPRTPGNVLGRVGVAGRSAEGRKIRLRQYGDPAVKGELLIFGCIHGDECGASEIEPVAGCPPMGADLYNVPNLNPDGLALGSRLNGRGVDLNRNFPADWKPIGAPGSPQYSGPRPFSEPETRLAARIIRTVDPEVTIWFHQHWAPRPLVRAWGQSVPMARRYASLAGLPFSRLPWLAGTAPNWQNHAFPGTASFVVELPRGDLTPLSSMRLGVAALRLAREEVAG